MDDPRLKHSRHIVFNLTRPDKSLRPPRPARQGRRRLRPLPRARRRNPAPAPSLPGATTPTTARSSRCATPAAAASTEIKRFDMPGFRPRPEWVREMKRYGILPAALDPAAPLDVYAIEQQYWQSLWHQPIPAPVAAK